MRIRHVRFRDLPDEAAQALFLSLGEVMAVAVAHSGGGPWPVEDWPRRRSTVLAEADAYVAAVGDEPVGFLTYRIVALSGRPCVQMLGAYVVPEHQGNGLGFSMNARLVFRMLGRGPFRRYFLAADLLNPVALSAWRARIPLATHMYPAFGDSAAVDRARPIDAEALRFAAERFPQCEFDVVNGVLQAKTLPRCGPVPICGDEEVDLMFSHVVPERGDTVLMLVDGSPRLLAAAVGHMAGAVPRLLRGASGGR